jgi:hypothetical protein
MPFRRSASPTKRNGQQTINVVMIEGAPKDLPLHGRNPATRGHLTTKRIPSLSLAGRAAGWLARQALPDAGEVQT